MEYGMILLRVVAGLALAAHGSQKLFGSFGGGGPAGTRTFFAGLGFRAPLAMAFIAGLSEFAGGCSSPSAFSHRSPHSRSR